MRAGVAVTSRSIGLMRCHNTFPIAMVFREWPAVMSIPEVKAKSLI